MCVIRTYLQETLHYICIHVGPLKYFCTYVISIQKLSKYLPLFQECVVSVIAVVDAPRVSIVFRSKPPKSPFSELVSSLF